MIEVPGSGGPYGQPPRGVAPYEPGHELSSRVCAGERRFKSIAPTGDTRVVPLGYDRARNEWNLAASLSAAHPGHGRRSHVRTAADVRPSVSTELATRSVVSEMVTCGRRRASPPPMPDGDPTTMQWLPPGRRIVVPGGLAQLKIKPLMESRRKRPGPVASQTLQRSGRFRVQPVKGGSFGATPPAQSAGLNITMQPGSGMHTRPTMKGPDGLIYRPGSSSQLLSSAPARQLTKRDMVGRRATGGVSSSVNNWRPAVLWIDGGTGLAQGTHAMTSGLASMGAAIEENGCQVCWLSHFPPAFSLSSSVARHPDRFLFADGHACYR
jgi:hypothetical protein